MDLFVQGLANVLNFKVILMLIGGLITGISIGSLPGLTATMGVALVLPITFGMDAVPGILLLIGVYFGSVYGGSITAILLNTPGTPASAATALDGHEMAKKGLAHKALTVSTISSSIGGIVSVIVLILVAPQLATFALKFGAPETFALAVFGISIISSIGGDSQIKGFISGIIGLLIATIGLDPIGGFPRFTFNNINLMNGVDLIPVMIGLFATSEVFRSMEDIFSKRNLDITVERVKLTWLEFKSLLGTILRSSGIGTFIGMIPGAGADIASFVAYNEAIRFSKDKEGFGKGEMKGIAAPESANNAVTGGAMIPLLTLGIPGDAVTAVLLGALMVQGLQPGPLLFQNNGDIVYTLFVGMLIANILMMVIGLLGVKYFTKILLIPKSILAPIIMVLCVVGSYSLNNSYFDVLVMFVAGVIGYFMTKQGFGSSPLILGLILGPLMENNFRRTLLMSKGSLKIFVTRPISLGLLTLAFISLVGPIISNIYKRRTVNENN
ncbi:MAG: tripartite tricarboxylate transporter permease [Thermotaleaceae bacterium]